MDMARICAVNGICRDRVITCRGLICKDLSIQVSRRMMGIKRRKDLFVRECLIGRAKQGTGSSTSHTTIRYLGSTYQIKRDASALRRISSIHTPDSRESPANA